jgi:hypothetical protein
MTVFVALLPLLAAAGSPTPAPRAAPQSVLRSTSAAIRTGPTPGRSIRASLRPMRELGEAPDPIASALTIPPGELSDVPGAECKAAPCPVVPAPDDPNAPKVSRKDLVLALLARTPFQRLSSAATAIAESPIQIDYSPGGGRDHGGGWGQLSVGLRWRLDATGPVRHDQQR